MLPFHEYRNTGLSVLPVNPENKRPLIGAWAALQKAAEEAQAAMCPEKFELENQARREAARDANVDKEPAR